MTDTTALFNKLWVIESLRQRDLKTGKSLVEGPLISALSKHRNLEINYVTPETRSDFYEVLDKIYIDSKTSGTLPMVHLECHGSETGIELTSTEIINWDDVREKFIHINIASGLNLIVVMAACYGAHILRMATKMDRAPFWAAIGAENEVTAGHIDMAFTGFYKTFFETLSGDQAIAALNQQDPERTYHFISAERFFIKAYRTYYESACRGKGKKARIEQLVTKALKSPAVRKKYGVSGARKFIKALLTNESQEFERFKHRYFMFDLFPENRLRFTTTYEQAIGRY